MSLYWKLKVLLVSCVLFSSSDAGGSCGPNKKYACVPTQFCSDGRSVQTNSAAYYNRQCFSFETCCDVNKVVFGKRYTGGQFVAGPYEQGGITSEPPSNTGGKTYTTNSQTPNISGGKVSITNTQTPNTASGKTFTTNNQAPNNSDGKTATHSTNNMGKNFPLYNVGQTASGSGHHHSNSGKTFIANPPMTNTQNNHNHHIQNHNYNHNPSLNLGNSNGFQNVGKSVQHYNNLRPSAYFNNSPDNTGETLKPNLRMQ
ncbi:putative uncharacterized protein DDB_G0285119 [Drosophila takahashii]|uniref:putative uncharacterized protein DDB_G0285119 n=1 Tax=Drosophila takahashii TaxID=29030 RepID=UPI001CF800FB|nr:homeobox protein 2 [Drosophila takahashii]